MLDIICTKKEKTRVFLFSKFYRMMLNILKSIKKWTSAENGTQQVRHSPLAEPNAPVQWFLPNQHNPFSVKPSRCSDGKSVC